MNKSTLLSNLFIFNDLDFELLDRKYNIEKEAVTVCYKEDDVILSSEINPIGIGLITKGRARIYSDDKTDSPVLRFLTEGSAFGVASLFMNGTYCTTVIAEDNCEVTYITTENITLLCEKEPKTALNYIKFLSDRIAFLNKKVSIFTRGSTESKLAYYLCETDSHSAGELSVNYSLLADILGIGRASLYRALDKMKAEGIIDRTSKTITILNREELIKLI